MSEARHISPILDGMQLNETIAQRDGAHTIAATEIDSGKQFVVKIVSVPTSDAQMDALLSSGAFINRIEATTYFKEQARAILNEAKILRQLATSNHFLDYDCVQVVPSISCNGFDIYLLSPFRESIQQMMKKEDLTHTEVMNLGLDLCSALTACRQAGLYYVDLKPGNVFCSGQHYQIGDLGFLPLNIVNKYPLPDAFRSEYTPPELRNGVRPVNDTADIYSLGLLLYQVYNGGILPCKKDIVGKLYAPPMYADYEMAQIILRACAIDPSIRWRDPQQMSVALTRYMQRNGVRNTPIIPPVLKELGQTNVASVEEFLPEYADDQLDDNTVMEVAQRPTSLPPRRQSTRDTHHRRNDRRKSASWIKRIGKTKLVIGLLAIVLLAELLIGILVLTRDKKIDITGFRAEAGSDGQSITLYLDYDGKAPDQWTIIYTSNSGESKTLQFSGQSISIANLAAGEKYTFSLQSPDGETITGLTQIDYTLPVIIP